MVCGLVEVCDAYCFVVVCITGHASVAIYLAVLQLLLVLPIALLRWHTLRQL